MADFWADFQKLLYEYRIRHPKEKTYRKIVKTTNVAPQTLGQWNRKTFGLPDNIPGFFAIVEVLGGPEEDWKDKFARLVDAKELFDTEKRKNGQSASGATGARDGEPDGGGVDGHEPGDDEPGSVDGTVEDGCHSGGVESTSHSTSQAVNFNHVTVIVPESASPPPRSSSSRQTIWQRLARRLAWWWVMVGGTLGAVALVVALLLRSSSTPEAASGSVTSSANTVTHVAPTSTPPQTSTSTSSTTSTSPSAPAPSSAPTDNTSQQPATAPPSIVDAPVQSTHVDTDPGPVASGGHCKKVDAGDIRVFKDPNSNEQSWTTWPKGTYFWIEPGEGTTDRYRTVLRNGSYGWVTKNSQYVVDAAPSDCP